MVLMLQLRIILGAISAQFPYPSPRLDPNLSSGLCQQLRGQMSQHNLQICEQAGTVTMFILSENIAILHSNGFEDSQINTIRNSTGFSDSQVISPFFPVKMAISVGILHFQPHSALLYVPTVLLDSTALTSRLPI